MADDKKGGLKELSPITIYKNLPKTNCKECGQDNCMAFAAKIVNRELELDACKPLQKPESAKEYAELKALLKPAVKEIHIGVGDKAKKIGGKLVMYRHELTYKNPTAIAIDVTDEMPESEVVARVQKTENFSFEYIGNTLKLDMIAVRCTSDDADKFKACVKKVSETTKLPMILCAMNPQVMEAGIMAAPKARPLLYAANSQNWKEMAELAIMYDAPLVASSPNDLDGLMSLAKTLQTYGVKDIVLDPGTFANEGLQDTINNFTCYDVQQPKPATNSQAYHCSVYLWLLGQTGRNSRRSNQMARIIHCIHAGCRYADAIILHGNDGWSLLPLAVTTPKHLHRPTQASRSRTRPQSLRHTRREQPSHVHQQLRR
jgi:acetyl-CoA decarbonylase/synthase complex subunit gamma